MKTLTPLQQYKENRDRKIIAMFAPIAILSMGIWMVLSPGKPKHAYVEKATVSIVKDIWGFNTGVVLLILGGIYLTFTIIGFIKFKRANPRPE